MAELVAVRPAHRGAFNPVARNQLVWFGEDIRHQTSGGRSGRSTLQPPPGSRHFQASLSTAGSHDPGNHSCRKDMAIFLPRREG
jgi:hypothetical protein